MGRRRGRHDRARAGRRGGDGEVIGIVELAEGPWLNTAVPGVDPAALREGMAMHVEFLPLGGGEPVPVFVPDAPA